MNAWEIIFIQSKVHNSVYNGDSLLTHNWAWPREPGFKSVCVICARSGKGKHLMSFTLVPMLIAGESISREARQALRESRLDDAAALIMQEYGLSCMEASDLLDIPVC